VVAATNVNLAEAVQAGRFREDLYYRLNVAALNLLPLKERPGDILPLAGHFLERYSNRLKLNTIIDLSAEAKYAMLHYAWPGNIRELENVIHHALLICKTDTIKPEDLHLNPNFFTTHHNNNGSMSSSATSSLGFLEKALVDLYQKPAHQLFDKLEETIIRTAYAYCESNQVQTGRLLGISRNILRHRLKRYGYLT
jgi:sigma-54-specific transcriptional regulator